MMNVFGAITVELSFIYCARLKLSYRWL